MPSLLFTIDHRLFHWNRISWIKKSHENFKACHLFWSARELSECPGPSFCAIVSYSKFKWPGEPFVCVWNLKKPSDVMVHNNIC